jgi:N-acetylmuramoyl-L-alanine amidase
MSDTTIVSAENAMSIVKNSVSKVELVDITPKEEITNQLENINYNIEIDTNSSQLEEQEQELKEEEKEEEIKQKTIDLTETEFKLLCQVIEAEAKGESYEGKVAVGNVIINRIQSNSFPNTIKEVIYDPNQFSSVANGAINNTPSEESIQAANDVVYGKIQSEAQNALYFWAVYVNKNN